MNTNPHRKTVLDRRSFLQTAAVTAAAASASGAIASTAKPFASTHLAPGDSHTGPAVIASGNGKATVEHAFKLLTGGDAPVVSCVMGVGIVEADPNDMSVGLGGLPNEAGVVQLDSCCMDGPTHKAGSVGALEDIVHAAQVALKVLQTTDHVMIVGKGATEFAVAHGFERVNMLTPRARKAWLNWKRNHSTQDDWLNNEEMDWDLAGRERIAMGPVDPDSVPFTYGTIHCGAVNANSDLGATTTTSGLSWKIPGRVGDSPIIGAGMYCDNAVGSAGATGRGESVIQSCGSYEAVRLMEQGMAPTEACLEVCRQIAKRSIRQRRLKDEMDRPNFNVTMYALRKDGAYGSASLWKGGSFAWATAEGSGREPSAFLYERG
ncbi:MAG: N4-(beta-N-acetylglucosaminyl)-L-asparaginase [Phycisphaerales bacterium]|jgi:N4-(beta-N-acetylglucosaminyl)-L-asparaginase